MNDTGTHITHTIKYRLYPEGEEEISGVSSSSLIRVKEEPSSTVISSYLPEKIEAYIKQEMKL